MTQEGEGHAASPAIRTGVFAGSFDPFTTGHQSIADRALGLLDRLVIAIGHNPAKAGWKPVEERLRAIRELYAGEPRVRVVAYTGLTTEVARQEGATWLVRGVRSVADFEAERTLAEVNRRLSGIDTLLLIAYPEMEAVSSSLVRELAAFGAPYSQYIPRR